MLRGCHVRRAGVSHLGSVCIHPGAGGLAVGLTPADGAPLIWRAARQYWSHGQHPGGGSPHPPRRTAKGLRLFAVGVQVLQQLHPFALVFTAGGNAPPNVQNAGVLQLAAQRNAGQTLFGAACYADNVLLRNAVENATPPYICIRRVLGALVRGASLKIRPSVYHWCI